jgi:hypothetical protein
MPRRYPDRRRRRRGRRPPERPPARRGPPRRGGFTAHGFGPMYRALIPSLQGGAKKAFFNRVSAYLIAAIGLAGTLLGYAWLGPLGALLGLGGGLAAGGAYAEKERFLRR